MSKSYHQRLRSSSGTPTDPSATGASSKSGSTGSQLSGYSSREEQQAAEERLQEILRTRALSYSRLPNVTSVGVGERIRDGKPTGELAIQFTVSKKLSQAEIESTGLTPLPQSIIAGDGTSVPVDVVERSYKASYRMVEAPAASPRAETLTAEQDHNQRRRRLETMVPGISISHYGGSAGTLGAIVYDQQTGTPYILSNWHVLQGPSGRTGDPIVQPGPYDDSAYQRNVIGRLVRSHLGFAGDCAIASIEGRDFAPEILGLASVPRRAAKVNIGDRVVKSGRTTGVTRGVVSRVGVIANINYGGTVGVQQIGGFEIRPEAGVAPSADGEISEGGDSGSSWMIDGNDDERDIIVGLHFAGETDPEPAAEHALACNIHSVLAKLKVSLTDPTATAEREREQIEALTAQVAMLTQRVLASERRGCSCNGPAHAGNANAGSVQPSVQEGLPVYGNWCGPFHGSGVPVDDVDRACMNHDQCYDRNGYFDCGCDAQLQRELEIALRTGNVRPMGRVLGPIIRRWFNMQPCRGPGSEILSGAGIGQMSRLVEGGVPGVRPSLRSGGAPKTVAGGTLVDCALR